MADTLLGRLAAVTGGLSDAAIADAASDAAAQAEEQAILVALLTARRSEYEKDTSLLAAALKRRTRGGSAPAPVAAAGVAAVEAGGEIKRCALAPAAARNAVSQPPAALPDACICCLTHSAARCGSLLTRTSSRRAPCTTPPTRTSRASS